MNDFEVAVQLADALEGETLVVRQNHREAETQKMALID